MHRTHSKRIATILVAFSVAMSAGEALALPFTAFDPRSFGMGGTGVASGTSSNASFYNPALLASARPHDDFSLELPIVAAEVGDQDKLLNAMKDFKNNSYISNFQSAITAFNVDPANNKAALVNSATNLIKGLNALSNKALQGVGDAGLMIGIPSKGLGMALYVNGEVVGGAKASLSQQDITTINDIITAVNGGSTNVSDPTKTLSSAINARFALLGEAGISLAREFDIGTQKVALGITPKFVHVDTLDYSFCENSSKCTSLDNAKISLNNNRSSTSNFNLDLGAAKRFGNAIQVGLAVKNLIPQTYTTALGNTLKVDPQARVGVAMQTSLTTLAADLDLTENAPVEFDSKTRYLGLGAEFNAWRWAQLRVGYRYNTVDSKTSVATAGFGLSPFGIHIDVSGEVGPGEVGASLQTGFRF